MNTIILETQLFHFIIRNYRHYDGYRYNTVNEPRPLYSLALITHGDGELFDVDNSTTVSVTVGDLLFIPVFSKYKSVWKNNASYTSIHFLFGDKSYFNSNNILRIQKITPDNKERIREIFDYLTNFNSACVSQRLKATSIFYELLEVVTRKIRRRHSVTYDKTIITVMRYVQENFSKKITVEDLALSVNMSLSRFFPYFKKKVGLTPVEYINKYRIEQACIMLINSREMPIEEISDRVGFESAAYFRRVFKKAINLTPKQYRQNPPIL